MARITNGSLTGWLLVASPALSDPNFRRTVVLICAEEPQGTLGVVINRPLPAPVAEHLPQLDTHAAPPAVVFGGGPVEPRGALALGRRAAATPATRLAQPPGWTGVTDEVGLVDLDRLDGFDDLSAMRVFSGHAGWTSGQLEAEIAEAAWIVVESRPEDAFSNDPDHIWRTVLRRQGGALATLSTAPDEPRMN